MADLSKFSTADLEAIANNKLGSVSDSGLALLHDSATALEGNPAQPIGVDPNAAVQGFGNMALAGYVPELTGKLGKILPDPDYSVDAKLKAQGFNIQQPKFQGETTDDSRAMQKQMASDSPYSYYGGGIGGAIASAPAFGSAMRAVGIAKDIAPVVAAEDAGLFGKAGAYAKTLGAKALQAGKEGAALGLVANPNTNVGDSGLNVGGRLTNAAVGGVLSSAIPVATNAAKDAASAAGDATKWTAVKALSNIGGVNPGVINEYLQFSDQINKAPGVEALKDLSDQFVGKLADDVEAKNLTAEQAKAAYNGFQSDLKDQYKTAGYDARDAVNSAQQTLKDAQNARTQQLAGDIYDTVNQLKSDVQKGSAQALDVLGNSDKMIKLKPIYEEINSQIDRANQSGTKEGASLAQELTDYRQNLAKAADYSGKINPVDAKRKIQGIDQITKYSPMAGSFDKMKNAAYKGVRSAFDQSVKETIPEYAQAMQPVAKSADLLSRVSDFGDKQTAAGLLGRINNPNQMDRAQALQELGKKYGVDFISASNPENLPEQQILNKALSAQESLRPDRVSEKIDQTLASSRQKSALDQATSDYQAAKDKIAPFKPLAPNNAGQTSSQAKLEALGKGKNIELTDMFQKLGKLTDTDFVQAMKDQNTLAAFKKGAMNGSRKTLLGGLAGMVFGGIPGAAIGGEAGHIVDQWGPAITKKVLDGVVKVSKNPAVSTISQLDLPEPIKRNMVISLENYFSRIPGQAEQAASRVAKTSDDSSSDVAQSQPNRQPAAPTRGEYSWTKQGIQKLGIQDQTLVNQLLQSPKGKQLLIQASDLTPGSKAMQRIIDQIQKGYGKK